MRYLSPPSFFRLKVAYRAAALLLVVTLFLTGQPFGGVKEADATFTGRCDVFVPVSLGTDDAQQVGTTMTTTGTTIGGSLDATTDWVGLRFQNINIPQGATIYSAYVKLAPSATTEDEPLVTIYMENVDDSSTFTTSASNISNRSRTTGISWSNPDLASAGASYHDTEDFASEVQAVVNRAGWTSGNDMSVIIQGTASTTRDLTIESFENTGLNPPILYIEYEATGLSSCTTVTEVGSSDYDGQQISSTVTLNGTTIGGSLDASSEWIGLQFDLSIPQGSRVTSAYVTLVPTGTGEDEPLVTIYAENADDSTPFTTTSNDMSGRSLTSGTAWSSTDLAATGSNYENTPDITADVQAVINRAGWDTYHRMAILMRGQGSDSLRDLTIKPWEAVGDNPAYLIITYEEPTVPSVTTNAASSVSTSSLSLNGNLTATGGPSVTERGFIIGNQSDLSDGVYVTQSGSFGTGSYSTTTTGLSPGTLYYYRAYAENSVGEGYGSILSTTTIALPPGTPTFSNISSTTMRISWTASTPAGDSYKLERCTGSGCSDYSQIASGITNLYYDDTGRSAGTTYRYRVRATVGGSDGNYSTAAEQNTAPGKPFGLGFFDTTSNSTGFSYGGGTGNDGYHQIAECYSGGCRTLLNFNTGTTTTGLLPNTTYDYAVRSRSGQIFGEWTATSSITTLPAVPGTPDFTDVTETTLTVSWSAPSGGADTYQVQRCTGAACSDWAIIDDGIAGLSYADSTLSADTLYRYRILAENETGTSSPSTVGEVTTNSTPVEVIRMIRLLPGLRLIGGTRLR